MFTPNLLFTCCRMEFRGLPLMHRHCALADVVFSLRGLDRQPKIPEISELHFLSLALRPANFLFTLYENCSSCYLSGIHSENLPPFIHESASRTKLSFLLLARLYKNPHFRRLDLARLTARPLCQETCRIEIQNIIHS